MRKFTVIDNLLTKEEWQGLTSILLGQDFPWYFFPSLVHHSEATKEDNSAYKFAHLFFRNGTAAPSFSVVSPIAKRLDPGAYIFVRGFMLTYTGSQAQSGFHVDVENVAGYLTAIYYLNTNNGRTIFASGETIDAVGNRLVIFEGSTPHAAVNATDVKARVVINFNYFPTINSI